MIDSWIWTELQQGDFITVDGCVPPELMAGIEIKGFSVLFDLGNNDIF